MLGSQRALLFDMGWAIDDMRQFVEQSTSLPIIVVNSHTLFDHMGDNSRWTRYTPQTVISPGIA